ncbi:hypothetical protein F0344_04230 [Streptomyces finlayi]|uniref:Tetratricopeptide repeat protein n=1 Tax=Streptomyces finlayi TaxID=67296 RepID=A0A7G7BEZ8_9ACTN|nr:trypsin-like peptidase domain-containing protein [Streptomyces finlayi]QNE73913.1 hypothetical protein F0344_04230 [Streptomyces finlayi]
MEEGHVVQVRSVAGFGSGYLIAPRLVLTAAHVVPSPHAPGEVTVALAESDVRYPAVVRWRGLDDDGVDAALLEIPAEVGGWMPPGTLRGARGRRPQRWGRCATSGTEVAVAATGYPRMQRAVAGRGQEMVINRGRVTLIGRVRPHGGGESFEILDDIGLPPYNTAGLDHETARQTTHWSGMSGAAVLLSDAKLLLGVVSEDRRPDRGTRLTYTRSEDLLACAGFRTVLREAVPAAPQLEPAELAGLLEPAPPRLEVSSPTMLLRADAEVVSFHGREDTLADLERWCLADPDGAPAARVLTGPGGQGKTRLARQLTARMRDRGWTAGQVLRKPQGLRALRMVQQPVLLIVDYAETRPELVRELWEQTRESGHQVRLLLLARSLGSWATRATGYLPETRLHALDPGAGGRERAFRMAAQDLARRLAEVSVPGVADVDWPGLADSLRYDRPGAHSSSAAGTHPHATPDDHPSTTPVAETALTVQMAALAALLRFARIPDRNDGPLEARLLAHEKTYWVDAAGGRGLGARDTDLLEQAVAAAVLCPAQNGPEARATIAQLLPDEPTRAANVVAWLRDVYPPPQGRHWGRLEPDRLAEFHASEQVVRERELLPKLFASAPDHQRVQILTVLARSAVTHANEGRAREAHHVIKRLRAVLRNVPDQVPLTAAMLRAHADALPRQTHVLRDYVLDVARRLDRLCGAAGDGPQALRDRAWALHNLAERHLAVGAWTDAAAAAKGAATLRQRLADDGTTTHRTEWADSLLVLSRASLNTGCLTEAHLAGVRALGLYRELAAENGEEREKRESGLVRALLNLSSVVWRVDPSAIPFDQIAQSDAHTDEAVRRARQLAALQPDLDPLLLVAALTERGTNLWRLSRHTESLPLSEEALETSRRLATENPDAWIAHLADALRGLALAYSSASRPPAESAALQREAIALLRPLAKDLPEVHQPTLAQTLHNLAWDQFDDGEHEAALETAGEAVDLRRARARDEARAGVSGLARAVSTRATFQARLGDHRTAVEGFDEALRIYTGSALPLSASDMFRQSAVALRLVSSYDVLGRAADALATLDDALAVRRRLSTYAPSLYTESHATGLHNGSDLFWRNDRPVAARILLRQALLQYRRLARDGEGRQGLAFCLHDLGTSYATSWATADRAVPVLREAYELRVALSADDPGPEHESALADTCAGLGHALLRTSRFPAAAHVAEHEVHLRKRLLALGEEQHERPLCHALLRLADAQAMADRPTIAWSAALEAERACQTLATRPGEPPDDTAWLLYRLGGTLSLAGRHDIRRAARGLAPARRAVRLYRRAVDRDPSAQADLNYAVAGLARVLDRLGRHDEAADVRLRRAV